jgi:2-polyprenyl-6-hydroxyphenyl methylase/3-demethylubiquinone-9 3-methyltransferase
VAWLVTRTSRDRSELSPSSTNAPSHTETHGDTDRLLQYRLELILRCCEGRSGVLLEIGCGTALHLAKLAPAFSQSIGADISSEMVDAARRRVHTSPYRDRIELRVDPAEELRTINDASVDVVLCVGALEHMLYRAQALRQVSRVLKRGGVFVLLTPNGRYCWYKRLAPLLRCSTRHLSTDRFLDRREAIGLLQFAGLRPIDWDFWTFIPKGDMPRWTCVILEVLDPCGPRLPAGCMSRRPHSYRHQSHLTTLSIPHWCAFATADTRSVVGQGKMLRGGVECSTR